MKVKKLFLFFTVIGFGSLGGFIGLGMLRTFPEPLTLSGENAIIVGFAFSGFIFAIGAFTMLFDFIKRTNKAYLDREEKIRE